MEKNGKVMVPSRANVRRVRKGATKAVYVASLGNHRCAGPYLQAGLQALERKGIEETVVLLGDSLQAHNLKTTPEPTEEDWMTAKRMGDIWLDENEQIIRESPMKTSIHRFDDISRSEDYRFEVEEMIQRHNTDPGFEEQMNSTIAGFQKRNSAVNPVNCFGFLMEEIPMFEKLVLEQYKGGWVDALCYPGSLATVVKYIIAKANEEVEQFRPHPMPLCVIEFSLSSIALEDSTQVLRENNRAVE